MADGAMTVAVTGANGHVGANLVRALLAEGHSVRAVVHRNAAALEGLPVERVHASLDDATSLRAAFDEASSVVHLASRISLVGDPDGSVRRTNVDGAGRAARAALDAGVDCFVHCSSIHAYDLDGSSPLDEAGPRPGPRHPAYDQTKHLGEEAVRQVAAEGLHAPIVNPTSILGPHDHGPSRMGEVFLDLAHRRLPSLVKGSFDFVDVRDVATSIVAAIDRGVSGENHLLGGHLRTIRELATAAAAVTGVPAPRMTVPVWMARLGVPFAARTARRTGTEPKFTHESLDALGHRPRIDVSRARQRLGHAPRPFEETVQAVYDDFAARGVWRA